MWRMAEAIRLGTNDYSEGTARDGISASTDRAIAIINKKVPGFKKLLVVEGEDE